MSSTQMFNALSRKRQHAGPDCLPFWVWKENAVLLIPVIKLTLNFPLSTQTWPNAWKEANVLPLSKVDTQLQTQEFRGISVTTVIARNFKRTVYKTFNKHNFEQYITNDNFAFRTSSSCTNALRT